MARYSIHELKSLSPGDEIVEALEEPVPGQSPYKAPDAGGGAPGMPGMGPGPGAPSGPPMPGAPPPKPIGGGGPKPPPPSGAGPKPPG